MDMNYKDLRGIKGQDVTHISSLTDTSNIDDCVLDTIIELNDGSYIRITPEDNERRAATRAVDNLIKRCKKAQNLDDNHMDEVFTQYEQDGAEDVLDEVDFDDVIAEYDNYLKDEKKSKLLKGLAIGGGAAAAVGLTAGGAYLISQAREKDKEEEVQNEVTEEQTVTKAEIKGTSWEFYVENAPESLQATFYQDNFYPAYDALNTRMATHTYTSEAGVEGKLGLTVPQARLLYLVSHNYSDEEIAEIMGGELFNQIPMIDNDGNPVLDAQGNPVMEDSTVIIQQAYEVFQQWFKDGALSTEDIDAVTSFFDTTHDKEIVRKFIEGHNAMLNAENDDDRKKAAEAQRALYDDVFASDITDSDTKVSDEATAFISRTMYIADTEFCKAYNYTGKELIYKVGSEQPIEVTTDLFGPQFDAWFRAGMQNFDSENYLKRVGYNPDKYYINKSSATMSITDATCEYIYGKITSANEYIRDMQNADVDLSSEQQLEMIRQRIANGESLTEEDLNSITTTKVVSKLDELRERTYAVTDIEELIRTKMLELNRYPYHTEVFAEKWAKEVMKIKDSLSVNYGSKGSGKGTGSTNSKTFSEGTMEENRAGAKEELISRGATAAQAESMLNKAEEEANQKQGILGKDNAETQKKAEAEVDKIEQQAQSVYDEAYKSAFNYYKQYGSKASAPAEESRYMNYSATGANADALKNSAKLGYTDGKNAGIAEYNTNLINRANAGDKTAEEEARKLGLITGGETKNESGLGNSDLDKYVDNISTDGTGSTTVKDVIDESNKEDSNKDNNGPVTTNPGVQMDDEEENKDENENENENEDENEDDFTLPDGFVPIVTSESTDNSITGGDVQVLSEEEIINQINLAMQQYDQNQVTAYSSDIVSEDIVNQAINEVAAEVATENLAMEQASETTELTEDSSKSR